MRYQYFLSHFLTLFLLWACAKAHGGKSLGEELHARQVYARSNQMDLRHCAEKFERDGLYTRALERRASLLGALQEDGQMTERNSEKHQAGHRFFDFANHDFDVLLKKRHGCVLHPELTEGPYYVEGEKVRVNLVDGQKGVLFLLDLQIIDSSTCQPVEDVYVEIWHTNSTGVYSGVVAEGNGSGKDDPDNVYTSFNRGIQKTAKDGVVFFASTFPGHYSGRTPHVHVMTHIRPEIREDGTIVSNTATHIGQLFFDQKLILDIEKLPVYRTNKNKLITNAEDYYFIQALQNSDPIMPWMRVKWPGDDNAVLSWMPIGVNMSNVREAYVAATLEPEPTR